MDGFPCHLRCEPLSGSNKPERDLFRQEMNEDRIHLDFRGKEDPERARGQMPEEVKVSGNMPLQVPAHDQIFNLSHSSKIPAARSHTQPPYIIRIHTKKKNGSC